MRYCIVTNNKIKEEYSTLEEATSKLEKLILKNEAAKSNKNNKSKPEIIIIPDFAVGLKIYTKDRFIGEIVDESENLWFTKKYEDQLTDPWLKENFEQKYIDGIFVIGE